MKAMMLTILAALIVAVVLIYHDSNREDNWKQYLRTETVKVVIHDGRPYVIP